jgi:ribonuclease T1
LSGRPARVSARTLLLSAGLVIIALLAALLIDRCSGPSSPSAPRPQVGASSTPTSGLPTIEVSALPPEAVTMLSLIDRGGPYRYAQDGTVFGNNEGLLPKQARGYYHEYTVVTPGSKDRGTRRLIVGRLGDVYYSSDHYESFRQVIR